MKPLREDRKSEQGSLGDHNMYSIKRKEEEEGGGRGGGGGGEGEKTGRLDLAVRRHCWVWTKDKFGCSSRGGNPNELDLRENGMRGLGNSE